MAIPELDLAQCNAELRDKSPDEIIQWAVDLAQPTIVTTSFGPNSGALLRMCASVENPPPVVWVDSGYNMRDTYVVAQQLIESLSLDARVYTPTITAERLNVMLGGIPTLDDPDAHAEFTRIVKLEPFQRALKELSPKVWISGIRQGDTEFRKSLDILSYDKNGILKVAPIFYWSESQLTAYMEAHELPSCRHYFDPTKVESGRECGMHTAA